MFTRRGTYASRKSPPDRLDRNPCRYGAAISFGNVHAKQRCRASNLRTVLLPHLGWIRSGRPRIYDADAPWYAFYAIAWDLFRYGSECRALRMRKRKTKIAGIITQRSDGIKSEDKSKFISVTDMARETRERID